MREVPIAAFAAHADGAFVPDVREPGEVPGRPLVRGTRANVA